MATRENQSNEARKEEKLNNEKSGEQKPGIGTKALRGTKVTVGFIGNSIQTLATTALVWLVGGFVAMMVSDLLGLGILGTAAVLAGAFAVVEGIKFLFSEKYAMHRQSIKSKASDISSSVTGKQQAA